MVRTGGGRSKGCRTCRRRKVRCDERHPTCERCEKGSFECEGYAREHRFVDEVARTVRHAQKALKEKSPLVASSRDLASLSANTQAPPAHMRPVRLGDNAFISFLLSNLFSGIAVVSTPWMRLQAEDTTSLTAQKSILALSKVYFGRMHRQQEIISEGFALYGDALRHLNQDLHDEEKAWSLSVLLSAMSLEIYEFVAISSSGGWLRHAGGVARLIELRGPWRHQTQPDREILQANRALIALHCLVKKERCFLEQEIWKTIPWALEPESKERVLFLHDILCDMPGLMQDASDLQNPTLSPDQLLPLYQSLSRNIEAHLAELYAWRMSWEQANPHACHEVPNLSPQQNPLFPSILHFSDLSAANEITFYNSILLLLYQLGFQIIGPSSFNPNSPSLLPKSGTLPDQPPILSSNPLCLPGHAPSAQAIATEICRSAEYHLLEEQGNAGAFFLLFPLRLAYQTFEDGAREKIWLEGLMTRVAELSGWEIGRYIGGDAVVGR